MNCLYSPTYQYGNNDEVYDQNCEGSFGNFHMPVKLEKDGGYPLTKSNSKYKVRNPIDELSCP